MHPFVDYLYLTLSPRSFTSILYGVFSIVNYTLIAISLVTEFCKFLKMPYMMMDESYYISFCKARENIGRFGRLMLILIVIALISYTFCFYLHTFLDYLYLTFSPRNFSASLYGIFCLVQFTMGALAIIIILPAVIYLLRSLGTFIVNTLISIFGVVTLSLSYLVLASATNKLVVQVFLSLPLDMFN